MCKQRGVITHYPQGKPPTRHAVRLGKYEKIKINGATWDDVMATPCAWTFGHVDRGKLVDYVRELAAAKRKAGGYV